MAIVTLLILSNDAAVCDALHRIKVCPYPALACRFVMLAAQRFHFLVRSKKFSGSRSADLWTSALAGDCFDAREV